MLIRVYLFMFKKRLYLFFAVILLVGIIGVFYLVRDAKHQNSNDKFFALLKTKCQIFSTSPYKDSEFDFSVKFNDDQILCLMRDDLGETYELYVWQKNAFESKTVSALQSAVFGKISINPTEVQKVDIVNTFLTTIDGEAVTGETILPKGCTASECPHVNKITIQRIGKEFRIEEYDGNLDFFSNIHFGLKKN